MTHLLQTPFRKYHEKHNGKLVDFAGWEMPLHYGSILEEHAQCRTSGSMFDVSHMGRVQVTGRHARKFLELICTRKVSDMAPKACRYSLVCNEQGGVLDDILVYRYDDQWVLVVNASNRLKLMEHFKQVTRQHELSVSIDDVTQKTAMIAVQGPKVMDKIGEFSKEIPTLGRYKFAIKNLMILKMTVSRTGYTGEDGVEIMLGSTMANMAIKLLLKDSDAPDAIIKPAGLGARDSLRLEAGMPLYGHELDEHTDPIAAGLAFAVSLKKHETQEDDPPIPRFIGQDALEQIAAAGPAKRLVGLKLEGKRTARQGATLSREGTPIGAVTSGCLSPTLGYPIAMAYAAAHEVAEGDVLDVAVGSTTTPATIVPLPFYKRA